MIKYFRGFWRFVGFVAVFVNFIVLSYYSVVGRWITASYILMPFGIWRIN